jgi:hypothetical protein
VSSSRPWDQRVLSLNAPASAPVASVKVERGGGASPSSAIGQNGMQLRIPLAMVVRTQTEPRGWSFHSAERRTRNMGTDGWHYRMLLSSAFTEMLDLIPGIPYRVACGP